MKQFLVCWLVAFVVAFLLNGTFHGGVAAGFFDSELAHFGEHVNKMSDFNPAPVLILEALLAFVLVYLISSRSFQQTTSFGAKTGAAFSLATSATWSLANAATFKAWSLPLTLGDVAWHTALGALIGWLVAWLWNKFAPKA